MDSRMHGYLDASIRVDLIISLRFRMHRLSIAKMKIMIKIPPSLRNDPLSLPGPHQGIIKGYVFDLHPRLGSIRFDRNYLHDATLSSLSLRLV
jgi:hypothetical protein